MNRSNEEQLPFREQLVRRRSRLLSRLRRLWQDGLQDAETGGIGELSLYDNHPADLGSELHARQVDFGLQQNMERMLEQVEKALQRIESGNYGSCERCGRSIDKERLEAAPYVTLCIVCQREEDGEGEFAPGRSHGRREAGTGPVSFVAGETGIDEKEAGDGTRRAAQNGGSGDVPSRNGRRRNARSRHGPSRNGAPEGAAPGKGGGRPASATDDAARSGTGPRQGFRSSSSDEYARSGPGNERRPVEELSLNPPFGRTFRDGDDYAAYDGEDAWQDVARYGTSNTPQDVPPAVDYDDVYVDADELRGVVSRADEIADLSGQGVTLPEIYPDPEHEDDESRRGL